MLCYLVLGVTVDFDFGCPLDLDNISSHLPKKLPKRDVLSGRKRKRTTTKEPPPPSKQFEALQSANRNAHIKIYNILETKAKVQTFTNAKVQLFKMGKAIISGKH